MVFGAVVGACGITRRIRAAHQRLDVKRKSVVFVKGGLTPPSFFRVPSALAGVSSGRRKNSREYTTSEPISRPTQLSRIGESPVSFPARDIVEMVWPLLHFRARSTKSKSWVGAVLRDTRKTQKVVKHRPRFYLMVRCPRSSVWDSNGHGRSESISG